LREASYSDDSEKLVARCNAAAGAIESLEEDNKVLRSYADKALENSREFERIYKSTWSYRILSSIDSLCDFLLRKKKYDRGNS